MPNLFCGIDPGVEPAVAFVDARAASVEYVALEKRSVGPTFEARLAAILRERRPTHVAIENVWVIAGQGLSSSAAFAHAIGMIRGVLGALDISYCRVTPQKWKESILVDYDLKEGEGEDRKKAQKAAAVHYVTHQYPKLSLVPKRCRTPQHDLAEAVCLAEYARMDWSSRGR